MDWAVASVILGVIATIITAGIGATVAIVKAKKNGNACGQVYAKATELVAVQVKLDALENQHTELKQQMQSEFAELKQLIREVV